MRRSRGWGRSKVQLRRFERAQSKLWLDPSFDVWQPRHLRSGRSLGERGVRQKSERGSCALFYSGGANGSDGQERAVSSVTMSPVKGGEDQEKEPGQVVFGQRSSKTLNFPNFDFRFHQLERRASSGLLMPPLPTQT